MTTVHTTHQAFRTRAVSAPVWSGLPMVVVCGLAAMEFSGGFGVLARYAPVSPFVACLGVASIVAGLGLLWGRAIVQWLPLLAMIGYLLAVTVSAVASPLAEGTTVAGVLEVLKLTVFTGVVSLLAAHVRHWGILALAVVFPLAAISSLGLLNEFVLGNDASFLGFETVTNYLGVGTATARHAGPLPDPNFWARVLVAGLPLGLALADRSLRLGRWTAVLAAGAMVAVIAAGCYLTSSRGGFLALAVGVAAYAVVAGRARWLLVAAPAGALVLMLPGVGSRLFTFDAGDQVAALDPSVAGRLATQRVALAMIEDRPLTGVGPDGYFAAFGGYASQAGQVDRVLAPHNLFLGLWAEIGLLGLIAFVAVLGGGLTLSIASCLRARRMGRIDRDHFQPYAAGLFAGLVAWTTASLFLHLSYTRIVLLLVCLAAALWQQTRGVSLRPYVAGPRLLPIVGAAAVVGALAAQPVLALVPSPSTVTATGRVVPVDPTSTFLINLRTRSGVLPTLAVVIDESAADPIVAQGDVSAGLIRVSATDSAAGDATDHVDAALATGEAALRAAGLTEVFTVAWDDDRVVSPADPRVSQRAVVAGLGALTAGVIGLLGTTVAARRRRRRRSG